MVFPQIIPQPCGAVASRFQLLVQGRIALVRQIIQHFQQRAGTINRRNRRRRFSQSPQFSAIKSHVKRKKTHSYALTLSVINLHYIF